MIQRFVLVFVLNVNLRFSRVGDAVCLCDLSVQRENEGWNETKSLRHRESQSFLCPFLRTLAVLSVLSFSLG